MDWDIRERLRRIERKLDSLIALITGVGSPDDLKLKASADMPSLNRKVKMGPKTGAKKMAMPDFPIPVGTTSINLTLQPIDASGADVVLTPDMVGTLTDDQTPTTVAAGTDSLHYLCTIPAGTPGGTRITLTGGLTGNFPASPLSATETLVTPAGVPLATDLKINVSIGA